MRQVDFTSAPRPSTGYRFDRLSVMVVDDNRHMLDLIAEILRGLSIRRVIKVADAAEAFQELVMAPVDILIVDHVMDQLSGIEFTRLVRSGEDSPDVFVPIIMVSGYGDAATVEAARDAGVTEFLAKPLSAHGLYTRILEVIGKPRPFIRCPTFFGPDRRRQEHPYDGPERRQTPPSEDSDAEFRLYRTTARVK